MRFVEGAIRLDARQLARALNASARKRGIEGTIVDLALPALREIGIRWESGSCMVGHEHLATEQIEAWLHRVAPGRSRRGTRIVLGSGPEDDHRVGVDAFAVILAHRGWDVRVLGARVPSEDMVAAVVTTDAHVAVVTSHMMSARRAAVQTLRGLRGATKAELFYAGSAFATRTARKAVPGEYLGDDLSAAAERVTQHLRAEAS